MIRRILFFYLLTTASLAFSQKHFRARIKLDKSIDPRKIRFQYHDGKTDKYYQSTIIDKEGRIVLKGLYYSDYATINTTYVGADSLLYMNAFLISNKPASMTLYYRHNLDQTLLYKQLVNIHPVYDTLLNNTYREMVNHNKIKNTAIWKFVQDHKKTIDSDDTLKSRYLVMLKDVDLQTMDFFKKYKGAYFPFWYFTHNIILRNSFYQSDTVYLRSQLDKFNTIFPLRYRNSLEGRNYMLEMQYLLHPVVKNDDTPAFKIVGLKKEKLDSQLLRGKYILLDFWATWCGPCMKEMPAMKALRKDHSPDSLAIIGVSLDDNQQKLKTVITNQGLNWFHYQDKESEMRRLFGIKEVPTLILIDKAGRIVYKSDPMKNDINEIRQILSATN